MCFGAKMYVIYSSGEAQHTDCPDGHTLLLRKMTKSTISSFCLPNHLGEGEDIHLDQWKEIKYVTPRSEDLGIGDKYRVCPDLKI